MKKIIVMLLVALMVFGGSVVSAEGVDVSAEGIDLSVMTQDELIALINDARLELTKYLPEAAEKAILYEDENIRLTFTGAELDDYGDLIVKVIVENLSDKNLSIGIDNASINGWAIDIGGVSAPASKKAKDKFCIYDVTEDADLVTAEDLMDIEGDLYYYDSDSYDRVNEGIHIVWNF